MWSGCCPWWWWYGCRCRLDKWCDLTRWHDSSRCVKIWVLWMEWAFVKGEREWYVEIGGGNKQVMIGLFLYNLLIHYIFLLIWLLDPTFTLCSTPPSTSYAPSPLMQPTFLQLNLVISDYQLAFASPSLHIYICTLLQLACFHISTLAFFRSILICCMFTFLSSDMCCNQSVGIDKLVYSKSVDASSSGTYDTEWFGGGKL